MLRDGCQGAMASCACGSLISGIFDCDSSLSALSGQPFHERFSSFSFVTLVWTPQKQFHNLGCPRREFKLSEDMYAHDSIDLLKDSGIDFHRNESQGIDVQRFGELLISYGIVLNDAVD